MGWYGEHVVPRIVDVVCGARQTDATRERACAGLSGDVVEIGFGSGLNTRFYPPAVRSVAAVEPADLAWRMARPRMEASTVPIRRVGLVGESLPLEDDSVDAALSTWTMCTIPDLDAALAELRRVLRPGGTLHFAEHGLAPDESVRRWQRRLEPVQKRVAGGCHLTREIVDSIAGAGFEIAEVDVFYEEGAPKFFAALSVGVAVNAP
ncbi:class I SAM-dependent methyltransferase [Mumia zhuanghuii]|uniref:Class I SAM-dependent methyltransferase n=2 Tax=Mumia TaxID=1546255 RepID=A0ABW1QSX7_9ACTN|nr:MULTISPECIES: class I SAM-dependent methyltransferase [Mumia]KAA1420387.1 class I SAM-dependent methyltransferase [Mumia zhuanghuii]